MVWLNRGLCGLDFKTQTNGIGIIYIAFCFSAMVYGFVLIGQAESIVTSSFGEPTSQNSDADLPITGNDTVTANYTTTSTAIPENNLTTIATATATTITTTTTTTTTTTGHDQNENDSENENEHGVSEEEEHRQAMRHNIEVQGMKMSVGAVVSMVLGVFLIIGSRQDKTLLFVPWMTEQVTGLVVFAVVGLSELMKNQVEATAGYIVLFVFLFFTNTFFTYAVMSHFMMLRRLKQHSKDIINSVMQGNGYQTGVNYDQLREEIGQGRELQEVGPTNLRTGPDPSKRDDLLYFSI